jgi:Cu(I)/Ag(I) efflux system periplasmic protein CusF
MKGSGFQRAIGGAWMALAVLAGQPALAQGADLAEGEVRKVDKDSGKITLRHGPIRSLDMPGMTMVFGVKDVKLFDKLRAGDKIRFAATQEGGQYVVTEIQPVK